MAAEVANSVLDVPSRLERLAVMLCARGGFVGRRPDVLVGGSDCTTTLDEPQEVALAQRGVCPTPTIADTV
jgi:hypothetical protein